MPRFLVPALFVLLLLLPTAFAAERPVAPLDFGAVPGDQIDPDVAPFDGGWLAVWEDRREGFDMPVYAARIGAGGEILDPRGIRLPTNSGGPVLACSSDRCLVLDRAFNGAIVDREGTIKNLGRLIADYTIWNASVFWSGSDFIVFWTPRVLHSNGVFTMTVGLDGNVKSGPTMILPPSSGAIMQAAAFNGSRVAVLYQMSGTLRVAITSATGAPLSDGLVLDPSILSGESTIAAAANGFVAAWGRWSINDIVAVGIDDDGAMQGLPVPLGAGGAGSPRLTRHGDGHVLHHLLFESPRNVLVARTLSADLRIGPAEKVPTVGDGTLSGFAVASGNAEPLVITAPRLLFNGSDVEVFAVGDAVGDVPVLVTRSAPAQYAPSIAAGPAGTIVAWQAARGGGALGQRELRAAVTDRSGGYQEFSIAEGIITAPKVAAAGDAFLVVWREYSTLRGRLIRHGELGETMTIAENVAMTGVAVSAIGSEFVVAWTHEKPNRIALARIFAEGTIVWRPQSISIASMTTDPYEPVLACASGECLLAWRAILEVGLCPASPCTIESRVFGLHLDASLVSRDAAPLELRGNGPSVASVSVAAGGDGSYAIGWSVSPAITIRVLDLTGALGPAIEQVGHRPALARERNHWLLVRNDSRAANQYSELAVFRFTDQGGISDSTLYRDPQSRTNVSAVADGSKVVIAYERTTRNEAAGGVPRIYLDVLEAQPPKRRSVRR